MCQLAYIIPASKACVRSAVRIAPGAYWAAWADAWPGMHKRNPSLDLWVFVGELRRGAAAQGDSLRAAAESGLDLKGFADRPIWEPLLGGARPLQLADTMGPGEWTRGWQFHACDAFETHYREQALLPAFSPPCQSLVLSAKGPAASHWRPTLPTSNPAKQQ